MYAIGNHFARMPSFRRWPVNSNAHARHAKQRVVSVCELGGAIAVVLFYLAASEYDCAIGTHSSKRLEKFLVRFTACIAILNWG